MKNRMINMTPQDYPFNYSGIGEFPLLVLKFSDKEAPHQKGDIGNGSTKMSSQWGMG